jgi:hypothetical protein
VKASMQLASQSYGIARAFFDHTSLGVYGRPGADDPSMILIVGHTQSIPGIGSDDPTAAVRLLLEGSSSSLTQFDSGSQGGSLQCGVAEEASLLETACGWYDHSTIGILLSVRPAQTPAALAKLAQEVRDDVD